MAAIAVFLVWWFRTVDYDEFVNYDGDQRMTYKLRRTLSGSRIHVGPAHIIDTNSGAIIATADVDGLDHESIPDWWIGDRIYKYYRADGTPLDWEKWFTYVATEIQNESADARSQVDEPESLQRCGRFNELNAVL